MYLRDLNPKEGVCPFVLIWSPWSACFQVLSRRPVALPPSDSLQSPKEQTAQNYTPSVNFHVANYDLHSFSSGLGPRPKHGPVSEPTNQSPQKLVALRILVILRSSGWPPNCTPLGPKSQS